MTKIIDSVSFNLINQYYKLQENKGALVFVFVLIILLVFAYAFYCTSKGYNYAGSVTKSGANYKIACTK